MRKQVAILGLGLLAVASLTACDRVRNPIGPPPAATAAPPASGNPTNPSPAPANPTARPAATAPAQIPAATAAPAPAQAPAPGAPAPGGQPGVSNPGTMPANCAFPAPNADLDSMSKTTIELAPRGQWFHRVFNPRLFHAPNWDGADSWFVTLALGPDSGGHWISFGNPGQIIHRGTETHQTWCLGILTTSKWKSQFLAGSPDIAVAVNVKIAHDTPITVRTASGQVVSQATSDQGDITIILPDSGTIVIWADFTTAAPTFESPVWWGPYDRSVSINTLDARK